MQAYLKALVPLIAGVAIAVIDKLVVSDVIPDSVWLALLGTTPLVWAIPNKEQYEPPSSVRPLGSSEGADATGTKTR